MQDFSCSHCTQDSSACLYLTRCLFHSDRGVAKAWSQAYFGEGSGPVLLDEVRCTGNELSIEQCPKSSWQEHNCGHKEDAGVSCTPLAGSSITDKHIRTTVTHAELSSLEREFLKSVVAQPPPVITCGSIKKSWLLPVEILEVQKTSLFHTKPWFFCSMLTGTYCTGHTLTMYRIYQ